MAVRWLPALTFSQRRPAPQQRLEIAEDPGPATALSRTLLVARDHGCVSGCSGEIVNHAEAAHTAAPFLDLVREACEALSGQFRIHRHSPGHYELAWRIRFDDLAVHSDFRHSHGEHALVGVCAILAAGAQVVFVAHAIAEALRPLGFGDGVPDRLRGCPDEDTIDLRRETRVGWCGLRRHADSFSSWRLRSVSADTRRSVNLSIPRSWMSLIGTGLRKCSFSRPDFRVTTMPASSRMRRCFMTPKRVISSSDSSSVSVRPSRTKSRSRRNRRVGSARALKTRSSSVTGGV